MFIIMAWKIIEPAEKEWISLPYEVAINEHVKSVDKTVIMED